MCRHMQRRSYNMETKILWCFHHIHIIQAFVFSFEVSHQISILNISKILQLPTKINSFPIWKENNGIFSSFILFLFYFFIIRKRLQYFRREQESQNSTILKKEKKKKGKKKHYSQIITLYGYVGENNCWWNWK